jgi:hypothetical protein
MFKFSNTHSVQNGGFKTVRNVKIMNGRGYKKSITYKNGKKKCVVKKKLNLNEITNIKAGKFVPGLFNDCKYNVKKKTKKKKN